MYSVGVYKTWFPPTLLQMVQDVLTNLSFSYSGQSFALISGTLISFSEIYCSSWFYFNKKYESLSVKGYYKQLLFDVHVSVSRELMWQHV